MSNNFLYYVRGDGRLNATDPGSIEYNIRPSVNLKSTIQIVSGSGTMDDPYILKGSM